jgi:RNA polymerase sigma-70 factor (ECF subfamily)
VQSEQEEMVQMLLDELAPEYRQAVVLRYWYELSYDEIAEMMDTTVSAIKSRLFRARRQLAEVGMAAGLHPEAESATIS